MSNKQYYTITDEDGDKMMVCYTNNHCRCSLNNCNDDRLELYEDGDTVPYILDVPRGEISWLLEGLLSGEYTAIVQQEDVL